MTRLIWRRPSGSAGCWLSAACSCLAWPEEYGGRGASLWEQTVVREEMWAHHEPRGAQYMGVNWVGPTIMRHGTPEQKSGTCRRSRAARSSGARGSPSRMRLGPGVAADRGQARRRHLARLWSEDLDLVRDDGTVVLPARPDLPRREEAAGDHRVPGADVRAGIEVRPIRSTIGPHHLNEVFFDELEVTEADVLGRVDEGWQVAQEVLAFERVGIARYARCERLLHAAPAAVGDQWEQLPAELRGRWAQMLTHCRRARLLAYRVVSLQSQGRVRPGDSAPYRIAVTRLDQDSAEVLMEIVANAAITGEQGRRFRSEVEDHWRYCRPPPSRPAASRCSAYSWPGPCCPAQTTPRHPGPAGRRVNIELSEEAAEFGRLALLAFEGAAATILSWPLSWSRTAGRAWSHRSWTASVPGSSIRVLTPASWRPPPRCAGAPATGLSLIRSRSGSRGRPTLMPTGWSWLPARAAAVAGLSRRWAAVTLDGHRSFAVGRAGVTASTAFVTGLELEAADRDGHKDAALGLVLPCWTLLGMLDRAIDLARAHVLLREQFGHPLATFQGVQFQLTDAEVERSGVEALAKYALWSVQDGSEDALDDALALRLAAIDAAAIVFRVAHQLFGAIGFCDETPLSWLSRYSERAAAAARPVRDHWRADPATRPPRPDRVVQRSAGGQAVRRRPGGRDVMNYDLPPELTVEADGPVRVVVINRPAELNAINKPLHRALALVWQQLSADLAAKVVILTGPAGPSPRAAIWTGSPRSSMTRRPGMRACARALRSSRRC